MSGPPVLETLPFEARILRTPRACRSMAVFVTLFALRTS